MSKCLMTKSLFKCIVITIVFISVTLSNAYEGLKICRRIKSNSLKLSAMGPLGATDFVLLTTEGHLFIVPKSNLLNVGQPSMNLYLDRVPITPERVFGVKLNYTQQEYRHFFILHQKESNSTLLVTAEQGKSSEKSIFRAFYFEWNRNSEESRAQTWEVKLFAPAFVMNGYMDQCATEYFYGPFGKTEEYDLAALYVVCWTDHHLSTGNRIDETTIVSSRIGSFAAQVPIQTGFELPLDGIFHRFALLDSGELYYNQDGTPNPRHLCLLKDFIQCGPGFRDETDRWEEPKSVDPESPIVVSTESTQPNDGQPSNIIWILLVVAVLVLVASLFCWLCRKKKKKRIPKNRAGSGAKDTSSNKVSSPNSSIGTGPTSSKATSSRAPKPKKKKNKVKSRQVKSVKDKIWSILKGGRKKAAKSRVNASKANKSKANKSKANKSSCT